MKIAIFGGSFDPPHTGHLELARAALRSARAERVLFIPAARPPHKPGRVLAPFAHRLAMVRLLIQGEPAMDTDDIEETWGQGRQSYTVETIRELIRRRPGDSFRLLIGADMALTFDTWKEADTLLRLAPPLVAARPGFAFPAGFGTELPAGLSPEGRAILARGIFTAAVSDCASTAIREGFRTSAETPGLIPAVAAYIRENGLYAPQGETR